MDPNQPQIPSPTGPLPPPQPLPPAGPANQQPTNEQAAELVRQQVAQAYQQQAKHEIPGTTFHPFRAQPVAPPPDLTAAQPQINEQPNFGAAPQQPAANALPAPQQVYGAVPGQANIPGAQQAPSQQLLATQQAAGGEATVADLKQQILKKVETTKREQAGVRIKPFLVAAAVTVLFLGVSYNEVAVAQIRQYISPGSTVATPIILDPSEEVVVGDESKVIIPKINVDVPVVYDITSYDENEIQAGLERGVVHYGRTALPGERGNNVIVGHSSNNFFNSGKYKFAFVLLDRLDIGDTFILHHEGVRYIYRVNKKVVVEPDDFSVVEPTATPTTTLITCTPPGTSWRRLVIQGEQISPSPDTAKQADIEIPETIDTPVPGNAPSFWQRLGDLF